MDQVYKMVDFICKEDDDQKTGLSLKDFTNLYGMSKMIVPEESSVQGLRYVQMQFLELIEFLGRLCIFKNFNSSLEDLPLHKQL